MEINCGKLEYHNSCNIVLNLTSPLQISYFQALEIDQSPKKKKKTCSELPV